MEAAKIGMQGERPGVIVGPAPGNEFIERDKYVKLWTGQDSTYRHVAPGEHLVFEFLNQAQVQRDNVVIDFGAGTGRASLMMAAVGNVIVKMVDFAPNCLDDQVREHMEEYPERLKFLEHDLLKPLPANYRSPFGFCTDVMEHIPTDCVGTALDNILHASERVFFQIARFDDCHGKLIGEVLHNTVASHGWWLQQFRDRDCAIYYEEERENVSIFYVSCWSSMQEIIKNGTPNTDAVTALRHIQANLENERPTIKAYRRQKTEMILLGGGPSLGDFEDEIRERRDNGAMLVTMNGTYKWALDHGMTPSAQVILDAREFNKRFLEPIITTDTNGVADCKYFLAAQCHPSLWEGLPLDRSFMFFTGSGGPGPIRDFLDWKLDKDWMPVYGGSSVMLRTIMLMRIHGFAKFHIYGFDSCLREHDVEVNSSKYQHHAYQQDENDYPDTMVIPINVGGNIFFCHPWMASQGQEFINQTKLMCGDIDMIVYGDGLIAGIIKHAAEMPVDENGQQENNETTTADTEET